MHDPSTTPSPINIFNTARINITYCNININSDINTKINTCINIKRKKKRTVAVAVALAVALPVAVAVAISIPKQHAHFPVTVMHDPSMSPSSMSIFSTAGIPPTPCRSSMTYFPLGLRSAKKGTLSETWADEKRKKNGGEEEEQMRRWLVSKHATKNKIPADQVHKNPPSNNTRYTKRHKNTYNSVVRQTPKTAIVATHIVSYIDAHLGQMICMI